MRLRGRLSRLALPSDEVEARPRFGDASDLADGDDPRRASERPEPAREGNVRDVLAEEIAPGDKLRELRERMNRVLERSRGEAPRRAPEVDLPELPFVTEESERGPLHVRARRLSAAHRVGHVSLSPAREARADVLALLALDPTLAARNPERALYLDTETTGLSGGTGTVAFLVGLAY
ncbi:MAG: hypothetical protein JNM74_19960, partial [Myxococcales bacterium]|nr:hypothetical protein [Myxococcales bacterium]